MTQETSEYDLNPKPEKPKPGEPGWVEPVPVVEKVETPAEETPVTDLDVETHKGMAILGYIFFVIPLVAAPKSPFARYHANQGLLLFIVMVIIVIAVAFLQLVLYLTGNFLHIDILRWFFSCIFGLLQVALLIAWMALAVVGIINAANGLKKPLPGIGHWTLIK